MADGMCGPSNALQNFQKHSTVDRTLQQDRLISRQSPSQGFRSTGPNAGLLDHEFESFQAGQLSLDHGFQHAPSSMQQPGPPNWAADFQRMNISSPVPQIGQQPFSMHAQQRQDTASWHQDFAQQQMAERSMQVPSQATSTFQPRMLGMSSQFTGYNIQQPQLSIAQQKQPEVAFDEAAFERAFEEAARAAAEIEAESIQQPAQQENVELGQDIMLNESAGEPLVASEDLQERSDELLSQERIGADTIHDPLFDAEDQPQNDDPEELARTAGKLLDSVQHEQSSKFQNSQFLSLMRQFRDREKTVQGDHVVTKNGMGEETSQDMNGERYQERIISICDALEHLALDPKHPFRPTPMNVRELMRLLLSLNALNVKPSSPTDGQPATYAVQRVETISRNLLLQPWIKDLHTCFSQAFFILNSYPLGRDQITTMPELRNVVEFGLISQNSSKYLLEFYVSSLRSRNPNALLDVLPYQIPVDDKDMDIHEQIAAEILGGYVGIAGICRKYDVWDDDIPVEKLVGFMSQCLDREDVRDEALQLKMEAFHNRRGRGE